ncbi:MAG: hypothetical protein EHM64_11160 [Ignavibacteriae bacterium]|nr:MAG: hypothetical protein EHM64_11160 [Ignavibacteriota bacterium]
MDLRQKIEEIAAPFLGPIGAFIVDVHIGRSEQRKVLQLYVDTDSGITIGQCTDLNRKIGEALEKENMIQDSYILEVSSPDITKPLRLLRQYNKNVGRTFRVRFRKGDAPAEMTAQLDGIEGETLNFITSKEERLKIPFHEIIESTEELPW